MNKLNSIIAVALLAVTFTSCKKGGDDPIIVAPPSDGSTLTLNGLIGAELGSAAGNSVYVDFSADKSTSVARASWDLGFYSGADFKVILNNTTSAGAKVLAATNLTSVNEADTVGLTLAVSQTSPSTSDLAFFDKVDGTGTAIPAISATAAENKVIILNRGTGGSIAARPWIKLKITRNTSGGYTLQYGKIKETANFTTVEIAKDNAFNYKFVSLNNGSIVSAEPAKANWDIVWGYSVYQTNFGVGMVPYNFSDLVFTNMLAGTTVAKVSVADFTYADFTETSLNSSKVIFSTSKDVIGSSWRTSPSQTGVGGAVKTDVFYVVKDGAGNVYKLKFNSYIAGDGGTRGKPVIEYKLIKKGS